MDHGLPSEREPFSRFSLEKLIIFVTIIITSLIPLLFYKGVNYATEFPKVIALSVFTPLLLLMLRRIPESKQKPFGYLGLFIYAYLSWLFVNSSFSLNQIVSFFGYYGNFTGFFFYLFSLSFFFLGNHFQEHKMKFIIPLIISASLVAVISILRFWSDGLVRAMGTQGHPINLANFLILIIPCSVGLLFSKNNAIRKPWIQTLLLISLYLQTTAHILTFSRAGWIGFFILCILFISFFFSFGKKSILEYHRIIIAIFMIILFSILSAYFIAHYQPAHSFMLSDQIQTTTQVVDASRIYLMEAAWKVFLHNPLGTGLSTFYFAATPYLSKDLREKSVFTYAHNDFFNTLATQGVVGGLFYLIFILLLIKIWWRWRKTSNRDGLTAGLWAGVFAHLIMLQSNFPAYGYTYLFWFFIGLLNNQSSSFNTHFRFLNINRYHFKSISFWKQFIWGLIFIGSVYYAITYFRADTIYVQAYFASNSGKYETAGKLLTKSIQLAPWVDHYQLIKLNDDVMVLKSPKLSPSKRKSTFQVIKKELLILNSLNPLDHRYKAAIGDALMAMNSYQNAITFFKQAAQLYPNNPDYDDRIGYSLIQLSKYHEAHYYFQKSLELDPGNQYAQNCLRLIQKYQ